MKLAIVYWSATGNTEAMADAVEAGAKAAGAQVDKYEASEFNSSKLGDYDSIALGCPAMGTEELEDTEFQPMFDDIKNSLSGKKTGLFGSYDWGDGEWMRTWQSECEDLGINLVSDGVIANNEPNEEAIANCEALGKALA